MKTLLFAAALAVSGTAVAQSQTGMQTQGNMPAQGNMQTQMDPNGPNTPPGDGITRMGNNPSGQAYVPQGFNQGINVYPNASMAPGAMAGMENYPRCSAQNTDRCVQTYTKMTNKRGKRVMKRNMAVR